MKTFSIYIIFIVFKVALKNIFYYNIMTLDYSLFVFILSLFEPSIEIIFFIIYIYVINEFNDDYKFMDIAENFSNAHVVELIYYSTLTFIIISNYFTYSISTNEIILEGINVTYQLGIIGLIIYPIKYIVFIFLLKKINIPTTLLTLSVTILTIIFNFL